MEYLNTAGENTADLQDLNCLGSRYFSDKEELAYRHHTFLCEQLVSMLSNFMFNPPILEDLCLKREGLGQKRVQNYLASRDMFFCILETTLWHTKTLRKSKS